MKIHQLSGLVFVVVVLAVFGVYVSYSQPLQSTTTSSSQTTTSAIQGIVTGFVTVSPSQPSCSDNQSCNVDLSGYSIVFTSVCSSTSCQTQNYSAQVSPSGHYSILLPPGPYTITGLLPSCTWVGCSSTFPQSVEVIGGSQIVLNFNIDTGIR